MHMCTLPRPITADIRHSSQPVKTKDPALIMAKHHPSTPAKANDLPEQSQGPSRTRSRTSWTRPKGPPVKANTPLGQEMCYRRVTCMYLKAACTVVYSCIHRPKVNIACVWHPPWHQCCPTTWPSLGLAEKCEVQVARNTGGNEGWRGVTPAIEIGR